MTLLALVGPTASGKTRIALDLAPGIGAEILSIDAMQVVRGMDVGTAKPAPAEQARVRHRLLDLVDPGRPFSVAEFQQEAAEALTACRAAGRIPLLVGGSGLYFRAVVDRLRFPPADAAVRARLELRPTADLADELRARDPEAAARTQGNRRRIVRALEVLEITGSPFSSFRTDWDRYPGERVLAAGLEVPPAILAERIERRTASMFDGALQEEIERLVAAGHRAALEAAAAIGYRQALAVVEGRSGVDAAIAETVTATRALGRRQMRWFRRDPRIRWFDAADLDRAGAEVRAYWSGAAQLRTAETARER